MKFKATLAAGMIATLTIAVVGQSNKAEVLLGTGLKQEETENNCKEAIKTYQKVMQEKNGPKPIAARAALHIGVCEEKLGHNAEARAAYERVVSGYSDQKDIAAQASERLNAIGVRKQAERPDPHFVASSPDSNLLNRGSISSDGRWMALEDFASGDVAIRDMSTGTVVRLKAKTGSKDEPGEAEFVALSPDMTQVAYTWSEGGKNLPESPTFANYQLRVMPNAVGGKPRVLVANAEFDFWSAAWFPDGKSILAVAEKPDRTWQFLRVNAANGEFQVIRSLEWSMRSSMGGVRPSISPDGKYIAYSALATDPGRPRGLGEPRDPALQQAVLSLNPGRQVQHIYVIAADGSGPESELVSSPQVNDAPVWTPDGKRVLFISDIGSKFDLWSVAVHSGRASAPPAPVMRSIGDIRPIGMTRSGTYYYRLVTPGDLPQIQVATIPHGKPSAPVTSEIFIGRDAKFSPDGRFVAFFRDSDPGRLSNPAAAARLIVRSLSTGAEQVYKVSPVGESHSVLLWLGDSSGVLTNLFTRTTTRESGRNIPCAWYIADVKSGDFKEVMKESGCRNVALSPIKRMLYTHADMGRRVVSIDIDTLHEEEVFNFTDGSTNVPWASVTNRGADPISVSPDGRTLILRTERGEARPRLQGGLSIVGTDGKGYRELVAPARSQGDEGFFLSFTLAGGITVRWDATNQSILYSSPEKDDVKHAFRHTIMRTALNGSEPVNTGITVFTKIGVLNAWAVQGASILFVAPDDRLMRVPFGGGEPVSTGIVWKGDERFSLSPDGDRIVFNTSGSERNEMFAIDNLTAFLKD